MRSLSSPAAVCAVARRRRVDARGDRARPGADRRKRSPSAGARAVFSSVVLNGDLNNARRCHRQLTAGWRRGGWDIATIACRALSTGNEDDESQEEDTETEREAATTTDDEDVNSAEDQSDEDQSQSDDGNKTEVLDELDDLFALLAQQRRGETLFAQEMQKPDEDIDLAKAAMYVAMHRRPDEARVDDAVEELDQLAAELEKTLPPPEDRFPLRTLKAISRYMFDTLEFKGNAEEFYDPRNSCLDEVLARRTGIPITLSLVYMELAKRVGVPMVGVNLPAHFMIRPVVEDMEVLVDCFNDGELKFVEDVEDMLRKFYTMGEADKLTIDRSFFTDNSVKPRAFLTRLLTNLKQIYFNDDEFGAALQIVAYQSHCAPDDKVALFNRRDGGICLFLMQRYEEALEELTGFVSDAEVEGVWEGNDGDTSKAQIVQMIDHAKTQVARESVKRSVEGALGQSDSMLVESDDDEDAAAK